MSDFGTMRNRILSDLSRTSADDLTSTAEAEIKSAIAHYERRRFWFLEQRSTSSTVTNQEFYGLPTDFRDIDSIVININNWTYPLILRTYNTTEDWFVKSATFTSHPTDYAIYDEQLRLYPIPNGNYVLTISYYKKLAALSNESDTNEWMVDGEELIRSRAESVINARKIKDFQQAQACKILEEETLTEHEKLTRARLMTGRARKRRM